MPSLHESAQKIEQDGRYEAAGQRPQFFAWLCFTVFSILILASTIYVSSRRYLWWDEIISGLVAGSPDFSTVLKALRAGADGQPPLFYAIIYPLVSWFGNSELVLRLPSLIAFWLATVFVFLAVRRRTNYVCAFVAAFVLCTSNSFLYATEARPYALVLLFASASFWVWQGIRVGFRGLAALPVLTLLIAASMSVHYYGFLIAVPLLVGEVALTYSTRKLDIPVLVSICLGGVPVIFLSPYLAALRLYATDFPTLTNFASLYDLYFSNFGSSIFFGILIVGVLVLASAFRSNEGAVVKLDVGSIPNYEWAATATYLLLPLVAWGLSFFTKAIYPRYVICVCIGAAILVGFFLFVLRDALRSKLFWVVALLALETIHSATRRIRYSNAEDGWGTVGGYSDMLDRSVWPSRKLDKPIILGCGAYLINLRYGPESLKKDAFYVIMPSHNRGHVAVILRALYSTLPSLGHVVEFQEFKKKYDSFYVYAPDPWFISEVQKDGAVYTVAAEMRQGSILQITYPH